MIEKEFRYTVDEFSAQLFENNILKVIFFYGRIPLRTNKVKTDEVMFFWEEHFKIHLNTTFPHDPDAVLDITDSSADTQNKDLPATDEIREAVKSMKGSKSPGFHDITYEIIKTDDTNAGKDKQTIWKEENSPKDWSRMLMSPIKKGDKQ